MPIEGFGLMSGSMPQANNATRAELIAASILLALLAAGLVPLVRFALSHGGSVSFDPYIWRVLRFTLLQSGLSTILSLTIGLVAAWALANKEFRCRNAFMALLALPQALPPVVVVIAFAMLFGANGWFANWFPIYGLSGILLVHVFFNAPLATRFFLSALEQVPPEHHRLAGQLGFDRKQHFIHVDWPALAPQLPRVAALVFLLCAASFATVLILGGPQATTLEVAIYQSLRLDFDVSKALSLSALQVALCGMLVWLAGSALTSNAIAARRRTPVRSSAKLHWTSLATIGLLLLLLVPALAALATGGLAHVKPTRLLLQASATSAGIAFASALLSFGLAMPLARAQALRQSLMWNVLPLLGIIVPPAVLATGWFLATMQLGSSLFIVILLMITLNAIMSLPFAVAALTPALRAHHITTQRLAAQLGLNGWTKLTRIDLPALQKPIAAATITAFLLSLGDLTAVTLFGSQGLVTLPSLIAAQMGNYRSAEALGTALVLACLCFAGAWIVDQLTEDQ
jgi:thiamine transport system permease protein